MARKVSNVRISQLSGSGNTFVAQWRFQGDSFIYPAYSPNASWVGWWVILASGAKYYNGNTIPADVMSDTWLCDSVSGDRAVLGTNYLGTKRLDTSVRVRDLRMAFGASGDLTSTTDYFDIKWEYTIPGNNSKWFQGSNSQQKLTYVDDDQRATYDAPEEATGIFFHIRPVAKTRKVNGQDVPYYNGAWVDALFYSSNFRPDMPSVPTVTIDKTTLTASVENISDPQTDQIQFAIFNDEGKIDQATVRVISRRATYTTQVAAGGRYRVLCRAMNVIGDGGNYSDWTELSEAVSAVPSAPEAITTIRGASTTSVYLEWSSVTSADTYQIEYATNINYFDGSNATTTVSDIETTHYTVTGLETGDEYFFRVCAVNDQGESSYTEIKSLAIGKPPIAPTTWSSSTKVITGKPLTLYWVHNAEDGSKETYAEVEITVGNGEPETYTVRDEETPDDEEEKTKFYDVDTSSYVEGTQLKWRVRTAGVTVEYGEWSIMRTVDIYAQPTLALSVTDQNGTDITTVTSFPIYIEGLTGPATQAPIGYHVSVIADSGYETVDNLGRTKYVKAGDAVYDTQIDTSDPLLVELSAGNIDLQNGISYTVSVIASMNSGLTVQTDSQITVSWTDISYDIEASIAIDPDTLVAYITPYASDPDDDYALVGGMHMSVYRREFDGTFKEIATDVDPTKNTVVTDPHPALDLARYRIVAVDDATGAISYYDPPGWPVGEESIVIQWDEKWSTFDTVTGVSGDSKFAESVYVGSMLKFPYNIDVSDTNTVDMTLVNYAGRTYPVSYYGTAIDSTSTWNAEIPATDTETIYQLRRLQIWKGDVYVREPSGTGYWANVNVSFNIKHRELTIPVTFDITRVEGGV